MLVILLWVARILVVMFVVRLLLQALFGRRPATLRRPAARTTERLGGTLVRDPQCGTYIPESKALTIGKGASARHFCSVACRDKWTAAHS